MVKNLPGAGDLRDPALGLEGPPELEIAPSSRILAREIPWTEEPTVHGVTKETAEHTHEQFIHIF